MRHPGHSRHTGHPGHPNHLGHHHRPPPRWALTFLFSLFVFFILLVTMLIVGVSIFLLTHAGILTNTSGNMPNFLFQIVLFAVPSIVVGTVVATTVSRFPLKPVNRLINGMNKLAQGDFDTRISMGENPVGKEIEASFNTLASDLQNTEVLRSDFVNNFSHEFKTPIVSIRGFAKLMQKEGLSEQQRNEYLSIIVEESGRLSVMATNILELTKLENQSILTDTYRYNLSEQLRNCILLLERGWSEKRLNISASFDEHFITANEDMLKQVWINLTDNAIKFSLPDGELFFSISESMHSITVSIKNNGDSLDESARNRVFDKFWQGDTSHSTKGTGIGLSIAKRVVVLHGGQISVSSDNGETVFTVELPK